MTKKSWDEVCFGFLGRLAGLLLLLLLDKQCLSLLVLL
jgi:hypothetical protein